jgi:tetratricopeptide (TPR) repeat protein
MSGGLALALFAVALCQGAVDVAEVKAEAVPPKILPLPAQEKGPREIAEGSPVHPSESASSALPGKIEESPKVAPNSTDVSPPGDAASDTDKNKGITASGNLALARRFRRDREWGRAIPPYETYLRDNPDAPDRALILLELGRTYAQAGALESALTRFYLVLDSAVNQGEGSGSDSREVAYSAQYEIAQTYMSLGRHAQAARLFGGMRQLPLGDEDRARIYLLRAKALNLSGDRSGAADEYRSLLQTFPACEVVSEARFDFVVLLAELGRRDEALVEVLALFEGDKRSGATEESWRYWQRRAGNKLANMFYDAGNLPESAELYSKLLPLSTDPGWRWPLLYQIGLVAEQMKDFARAREAYTELVSATAGKLPTEISELPRLARWRIEHLDWVKSAGSALQGLKSSP